METTWGSDVVSAGAPVSQPQKKIGGEAPRERADDKQRVLFFIECLLFYFQRTKLEIELTSQISQLEAKRTCLVVTHPSSFTWLWH